MSAALLKSAHLWVGQDRKPELSVRLEIKGKSVEINDMPVSNEMMRELVATFKRHLPKAEDL